MCREYEIFKCKNLIRWLIQHNQPIERALEVYSKQIFNESIREVEIIKNV